MIATNLYLIRNADRSRADWHSLCNPGAGWDHTYLTALPQVGDLILGRLTLTGDRNRLTVSQACGDLSGRTVTQGGRDDTDHLICLVLIGCDTVRVRLADGELIRRSFVRVQSRGGIWTPADQASSWTAEHSAQAHALAEKHGLGPVTVIDCYSHGHSVTALVDVSGVRHVIEWGESEDGEWDTVTSLDRHNVLVDEQNESL